MRVNLDKILCTHAENWCVKCTNPKGKCTGQASKLKPKCIILSNSRAQSKYAVINQIHTQHKRTF